MRFSANRGAYSDMPSFSSQSAICCIAAPLDVTLCAVQDGKSTTRAEFLQRLQETCPLRSCRPECVSATAGEPQIAPTCCSAKARQPWANNGASQTVTTALEGVGI